MTTTVTLTAGPNQAGLQNTAGQVTIGFTSISATTASSWIATFFPNANIPQGAIILSATLTVTVTSTSVDDPAFNIYAENSGTPSALVAIDNNISDRSLGFASVNWTQTGIGSGAQTAPDLKTVIQDLADRETIADLCLVWDGLTGVNFAARTYEFNPAMAPTLTIEYDLIPTAAPLSFYLLTETLPTVFTGKVATTPTDPYITIAGNTGVTGSFGSPQTGMTVWFNQDDQQAARLKGFTLGVTGSFSMTVGENDDVTPYIEAGDDITIKAQFRLWPRYPNITLTGDIATIYIDYDVNYVDQLKLYRPIAVAGPPAVVEYNGATAQARFVGDRSFALAPSATISSWLWTAIGSVEGTSTSQGTEASPVTFTWTSTGQKLVTLAVTDTNGKTATNHTWVFVVDPNNPDDVARTNFDAYNDNHDFEQGGGACNFVVHGGATVADFPNETMVIMASRPTTPGQATPTGYWPFRENVHFVGYILGNSIRQNPIEGDVSFQAATIDALMKNLTAFPVSLTDWPEPVDWTQAYALTTDRALSYLWHYHSTLALMANIVPSEYQGFIWRQDFGPSDLYSQADGELMASLWGRVVVNHQGVIHHAIDYNLMNDAERAEVTTRKRLHKGIWVDDVTVEERHAYSQPVNVVKMSGVIYLGGQLVDVCPSFSEAPGNAPKVYGKELNYDRLILTTQADLNLRCGRGLAKATVKYAAFNMRFVNDGSFTIVPQELFPSRIEAGDNDRGLAYTGNLIPRRMSRAFDNRLGVIFYDVSFEPETDGPPGVTVDLPCGPPGQDLPGDDVPDVPEDGTALLDNSLVLANEGSSFYFNPAIGTNAWEKRITGLTNLEFADMIPDPWTYFKQGTSIDNIILWGCGPNFLARTKDTGKTWGDRTVYLSVPPNSWSDGAAPSFTGTLIKQILGDYHRQDVFYLLLQTVDSGNYRGWIYHSIDDGFTFTPYALTGTSQALPIRMDLDSQDSSRLWVTCWEGSGNINLRRYTVTDTSLSLNSTVVLMTGTTAANVETRTYIAYPYSVFGNKDLFYVYGRLVNALGTVAIMRSEDAGANFTAVISDWDTDHCGALRIGPGDDLGNREIWAVKQTALSEE